MSLFNPNDGAGKAYELWVHTFFLSYDIVTDDSTAIKMGQPAFLKMDFKAEKYNLDLSVQLLALV